MKLKNIKLKNMRLFDGGSHELSIDTDKRCVVMLANNGCGKTSVLYSIVNMVSPFVSVFPGNKLSQFADEDVHITANNKRSDYLLVEASIVTDSQAVPLNIVRTRKGAISAPDSDIKPLKAYAESLYQEIRDGKDATLPILAYYSTERGRIVAPERKRSFQKVFERWDCYNGALEAQASFKRFFSWFDLMEDEERRKREEVRDWNYKYKPLEVVREALSRFIGDTYSNPRILTSPLRFVVDETTGENEKREIRIELMSDGFRNVTAMVADIASRMAEANPDSEHPLDEPGIILIDEIDLHLHPTWQRKILRQLTDTFRGVQFIVTTHSPMVLLGATDLVQVVKLEDSDIQSEMPDSYSNYNIGQLLLSPLFGMKHIRSVEWEGVLNRRKELLMQTTLTDDERKELAELNRQIDSLHYGESADAMKSRELIRQMAEKLGIEV